MQQPRIIFFGTPRFAVPVLEALDEKGWLWGVVTAPDKRAGRKQILTPSPTAEAVKGVPLLKPERFDVGVVAQLQALKPDLFVVAAYGKILPPEVLGIPKFEALNIHPSLLPKYRGPSPIQAAILAGEDISGVSIIQMDDKIDHGPILTTKEVRLSNADTFESLSTKMFAEGAELLMQTIPDFLAGKVTPVVQDDAIASYCSIIKKEDGYFDINKPPSEEKLDRMIRAYYPWPTVWTKWPFNWFDSFDYTQDKFAHHKSAQGKESKIVKFLPNKMIQLEGKKPVRLEDFLRGYPDFPIKTL